MYGTMQVYCLYRHFLYSCCTHCVLQSFFEGQLWHLFLLPPLAWTVARSSGWSRDLAHWTAFTTAADTSVWGRWALLWISGVTSAFPSCSRNTLVLFRLRCIQLGLISLHITKESSAAVLSNHLSRLSTPPLMQWESGLAVLAIANVSLFVQCAQKYHILVFLCYVGHYSGGGCEGKLEDKTSLSFDVSSAGGSPGLFFQTVPTMVIFLFRSCRPSS